MCNTMPPDGRILVEVMLKDDGERFTLRVRPEDAQMGRTVVIQFEDGEPRTAGVVSILERRE